MWEVGSDKSDPDKVDEDDESEGELVATSKTKAKQRSISEVTSFVITCWIVKFSRTLFICETRGNWRSFLMNCIINSHMGDLFISYEYLPLALL